MTQRKNNHENPGHAVPQLHECPRCHAVGDLYRVGDHVNCRNCEGSWSIETIKTFAKQAKKPDK